MPTSDPTFDALDAYRRKRSFDRTSEPGGGRTHDDTRIFVVQKHAASRLHWDLRLEVDGVLKSWAVPKGPSRDPADKRMAIHVEDHPIEYADFEGIIPKGNYGAGAVIVWDRGTYTSRTDMAEGFARGKLLFELKGYKLRGVWTLVKLRTSEKTWLLIKERDAHAVRGNGGVFPQDSVLSGRTVEDLGAGSRRAAEIRERLDVLNAPHTRVVPDEVRLMLAEPRARPFSGKEWIFEPKYDGYRLLIGAGDGRGRLISRAGNDVTALYPEVVQALGSLPFESVVMDGEIVVHDKTGLPSFQQLQKRARFVRASDIRRAARRLPATLYLFDLLGFEDRDLRGLPLVERKALLRQLLPQTGPLRYADHIDAQGEAFYKSVERLGLEGMVAKKAASRYHGGRSSDWIKVRQRPTDDFVIVGYTRPKGTRAGFGALTLATHIDGVLTFAGAVGTGFTDRQLTSLLRTLKPLRRSGPACASAPAGREYAWVDPRLVCEVQYVEITEDRLLRQPVFLRLRDDKRIEEVERRNDTRPDDREPTPSSIVVEEEPTPDVSLSHLDKVFWPDDGYTKGDLIAYYRTIAPWLLPYLRNRPVVLTRFPNGIHGKSFFQKDAPSFAPDWLHTETIYSESSGRDLRYFVCDDVPCVVYLANSAAIPLHIWASRVSALERPDWCVLDIDPKGAPFTHVVEIARFLHDLCDEIHLPTFVKTSGSSGLHVMIPLGGQCTFDQAKTLGAIIARTTVAARPNIATIARALSRRKGKVYIDYLQNGHGKLIVAPFSVRALPGAPVSMPLEWHEVVPSLDIRRFTIRTAPRRMGRKQRDPLRPVLDEKPDLVRALRILYGRRL